eukprot:2007248-Alexandrium_andersonii.AAC.1
MPSSPLPSKRRRTAPVAICEVTVADLQEPPSWISKRMSRPASTGASSSRTSYGTSRAIATGWAKPRSLEPVSGSAKITE